MFVKDEVVVYIRVLSKTTVIKPRLINRQLMTDYV